MTALCHIAPFAYLDEVIGPRNRHHLVIGDYILDNSQYHAFYEARLDAGDFVIMDTAAFEGEAPDIAKVVEAALILRPSEVVLPDDMDDALRTLSLAKECSDALLEAWQPPRVGRDPVPSLMAVPHGRNFLEYVDTARQLASIHGVKTMGIQEEVEELFGLERLHVAEVVQEATDCEIHLLGVTEHVGELKQMHTADIVRTCDTAKFVVWGLNEIVVRPEHPAPPYPGRDSVGGRVGYFTHNDPSIDLGAVRTNIRLWREYLGR